eukprot:TRINITY_DN14216_c0_g1_i1.p1 TRINITY_DN14216_c0_g1~~TRINITY_DN14216_c0_g1_i1.p1  ORF type:complete len:371 (+),score=48.88 TRINITY_DN14216_c0_g1_i1:293-1405(+)
MATAKSTQAPLPPRSLSREELEEEVLRLRQQAEERSRNAQHHSAQLAKNIADFWLPRSVDRVRAAEMSALRFCREYVAKSIPVVLTDLDGQSWPCLSHWQDDAYLLDAAGDAYASINFTPNGRADSVDSDGFFVKPYEETVKFSTFWAWMKGQNGPDAPAGIPYLSRQNDSLREEFPTLIRDVPSAVPLAVEAFGNEPEAVNLWIGDERSVSSCHMDHYENLYVVVRGEKVFTLFPPAAIPFLHERRCPPATYEKSCKGLEVVPDTPPSSERLREAWQELGGGKPVPWIPFDVAESQSDEVFPLFERYGKALALEVRLVPGEMLYLPATWYHRVAQQGLTIAVNYWHDMQFGHGYVHHQFLRDTCGLNEA